MKKRVADIIVDCLIEKGITECFSVVGGGAMHLNNAFAIKDDIKKIYCHHEQACSMAAEGYARACGKLAAVCVTSGPGGINALNGVQGAYVDSIPMIVISGHPRYETTVAYTGLNLRCRGVQENDIVYMVKKITKYAKLITDPKEVRREVYKAVDIAMDGRRGPVWLDIPLNVQGILVEDNELYKEEKFVSEYVNEKDISEGMEIIKNAKRPCILTGSGIRTSDSVFEFREFCKNIRIPIVGGALQADVSYNSQDLYYGMSGSIGPRTGNFILQNADAILVLGNSLSFKQTGFNQEMFATNANIIMVDTDEDEGKKNGLHIEKFIKSDLKKFFNYVKKSELKINPSENWISYCDMLKNRFPKYEALNMIGTISDKERVPVLLFWKKFMEQCKDDSVIALGNSSCVVGILQEGVNCSKQRVIVNYNCGSMGDDLPEAIGATIALNREVYCVTGDGSVMMNLQELQTIRYNKLPIKVIIFENDGYAAIRNTCSNFFDGMYNGCDSESGISFPNFKEIANSFEIPYCSCKNVEKIDVALDWLINYRGACVLEISQKINEVRAPRLESKMLQNGEFITPVLHDMSPFLSQDEVNSLMYKGDN